MDEFRIHEYISRFTILSDFNSDRKPVRIGICAADMFKYSIIQLQTQIQDELDTTFIFYFINLFAF